MKTVLLPNERKKIPPELCRDIASTLSDSGAELYAYSRFSYLFGKSVSYEDDEQLLFDGASFAVVLGGDGSIIEAARSCAPRGVPIVGVNLGRLGFLAEIEVSDISVLRDVTAGKCAPEDRIMLDGVLIRADGSEERMYPALNDIVLSNGPVSRLMSFDIFCDGVTAAHVKADGMIIATPTGSSAYSMSAGGPVLDPTLDCICATPICAHSFGTRPVVYSGESVISISNAICRENCMYITVDGRENVKLSPGDRLEIRRSEYKTKLIRVNHNAFMNVLNRKMSDNI